MSLQAKRLTPRSIYTISAKRQLGKCASETAEGKISSAPGGLYSLCNASYGDTTDSTSVDEESPAMAELPLDVPDELMQRRTRSASENFILAIAAARGVP